MEAFEKVNGYFKPKKRCTLRDEAKPLIGKLMKFEALWLIGEEDSRSYAGQWAMWPLDDNGEWYPGVGWVPEEDIELNT